MKYKDTTTPKVRKRLEESKQLEDRLRELNALIEKLEEENRFLLAQRDELRKIKDSKIKDDFF